MRRLSTSNKLQKKKTRQKSYILGTKWTGFSSLLINKYIPVLVHTKTAFIGKHHSEMFSLKRFTRDIQIRLLN